MTSALPALVIAAVGWLAFPQDLAAQALPAACAEQSAPGGVAMPLSELRMRAEAEILTDPVATVAILCSGLARASVELGAGSADTAWWALSLAMPLIAFLDRHAEAEPLLDFALPVFERELGRLGLHNAVALPELLVELGLGNAEALYLALGSGDMNVAQVSGAIQRRLKATAPPAPPRPGRAPTRLKPSAGLEIEGVGDLVSTLARCCNPVAPEPIAG